MKLNLRTCKVKEDRYDAALYGHGQQGLKKKDLTFFIVAGQNEPGFCLYHPELRGHCADGLEEGGLVRAKDLKDVRKVHDGRENFWWVSADHLKDIREPVRMEENE